MKLYSRVLSITTLQKFIEPIEF